MSCLALCSKLRHNMLVNADALPSVFSQPDGLLTVHYHTPLSPKRSK